MHKRLSLLLIAILLLSLSCTLTSQLSQPIAPQSDPVQTWVAETIAAGALPGVGGLVATEVGSAQVVETPSTLEASAAAPESAPSTAAPEPEATPLGATSAGALDNPPPDGFDSNLLRVAYANGNVLSLWTERAGEIVLYEGEPVEKILLSEDGWVIIFTTRDGDYTFTGLWRVNADGSDLRRLIEPGALLPLSTNPSALGVFPYQIQFVPGTRQLAFNTRLAFMGPGLVIQDDLRLLDTTSGTFQTLLEAGQGGAFTFSPDGSQIALVTPTTISLVNVDGSGRRADLVTFPMIMTYSEYQYYPQMRWESDSQAAWAVVPSEDSLAPDASMAIWRIPAADEAAQLRATYPFDLSLFFAGHVLSPDLQKVVYLQRTSPEGNEWTLHVARLDGSADNSLRTGNLRFETWSPDGFWVTIEEEGQYLLSDPVGNFRSMTDVLPTVAVEWVDNTRFLFLSGDYEAMQLRLGGIGWPSQAIGGISEGYIPFSFAAGGE